MKRALLVLIVVTVVLLARAAHAGTPSHRISPPVQTAKASPKITIPADAQVATDRPVTVAQVARIDAPKSLSARIGDVVITSAPLPGSQRSIESEYVRFKLASAGFADVKVTGAARITLTGKCRRVSPQVLQETVKDYAMDLLPKDGLTYEIEVERAPHEMVMPDDPAIEIKPRLFSTAIHTGVNTMAIDASLAGRTLSTTTIVLQIKATAVVLIAADTISQGQALTAQNTKTESRDVTRVAAPVAASSLDTQGWVARRPLRPGAIITADDVALPPDVHSGDQVTLTVKCGAVSIRTSAEAKQDGRIGDSIRVKSSVSNEELRAHVISPGTVEIVR